jgi:hypothetical protein
VRLDRGSERFTCGLVTAARTAASSACVDDKQGNDDDRERYRAQDRPTRAAPGTQSALNMLFVKSGHGKEYLL